MFKKLLYIVYQPYKWLFFIPLLLLNTLFFAAIAVVLSVFINPKTGHIAGVIWARVNARLTPMFIDVKGLENIDKNTSYVIVPNHQSYYDILLMYGWLGIDFKWVMKKELRKVPALGIACEKIGHIFLDRSNNKASVEALNEAKTKLINGASIVIFPEGTRSKTGKVGSLKKGAFKIAFDLQLPILPVTINGTGAILPPDSINIFPGKATMTIHSPIDINNYTEANINSLVKDVKAVIESSL